MNKVKTKLLLWLALPAVMLSSCLDERFEGDGSRTTTGNETTLKVTLQMPASAPRTYAISEIDENSIEDIWVLAFKEDASKPSGWAFSHKDEGTDITDQATDNDTKSKKQFTVTLIKDKENDQQLVILANVGYFFKSGGFYENEIGVGTDKDELLASLISPKMTGSWNANNDKAEDAADKSFTPFPMWGEIQQRIDDNTTQIGTVGMLRAIARVDVVLSDAVKTAANFTLNEVHVYNTKNRAHIVPAKANRETLVKVKAATVPEGEINNDTPLVYTIPTTMKTAFERTIYLFEAKAVEATKSSEATCLVVGGTYGDDSNPTYYRLDFFGEDGKTYKDVLRNHHYRINILSVSGRGYDTPEDAFNSKASNMIAQVVVWDDGDMGDVVFDGQYMLAVSQKVFEFPRDEKEGEVYIETDYDVTPNAGWKAVSNSDWLKMVSVTPTDKGTVSGDQKTATGQKKEKIKLTFKLQPNGTGQLRETTINVTAGRLTQVITVKQSTTPEIALEIINPLTGKATSELTFISTVGDRSSGQQFQVKWAPQLSAVSINVGSVGSNDLFKFYTVGYDGIFNGTTLPGGTGEKTYNIQGASIPPDDLSMNPFYERISKIDYTVSNGESYLSKSIFLRHIVYNLVFDTDSYYLMKGGKESFKIRANFPWNAEIVNDGSNVINGQTIITLDESSKTGSSNTSTPGTEISFTIYNDLDNPTVYTAKPQICFTHQDDPSIQFKVELNCVSGIIQQESNCYMVKPSGFPILIPVQRANTGGVIRVGTNDEYTAELVWTDNDGGVKAKRDKAIDDEIITGTKKAAAIDNIIVAGKGNTGYILVLPGTQEGNSVVSVEVGGVIKWSWHIWTTEYTESLYTDLYEPRLTPLKTKIINSKTFMDRSLGAHNLYTTSSQTDYSKTGLLYQWGRKDPTPTAADSNNAEPPLYNAMGGNFSIAKMSSGTVEKSIANPATVYYNANSPYDFGQANNSWGATGGKGDHDPCPQGWRVPKTEVAVEGLLVAKATWKNGYTWANEGYFPLVGYRHHSNGQIKNVGTRGDYWYSTRNYHFYLGANFITAGGSGVPCYSMAVRCVKDY